MKLAYEQLKARRDNYVIFHNTTDVITTDKYKVRMVKEM